MIRRVVDFALSNRLLVLGLALVLFVWGIISFHNLPIEALTMPGTGSGCWNGSARLRCRRA